MEDFKRNKQHVPWLQNALLKIYYGKERVVMYVRMLDIIHRADVILLAGSAVAAQVKQVGLLVADQSDVLGPTYLSPPSAHTVWFHD